MAQADLVRAELERAGIDYLVWLPDSQARHLYDSLTASPRLQMVPVCHEEEAVGLCLGLFLGGKNAAILIQNTGLFHSLDALCGMALDARIPLLLLIGYQGYQEKAAGGPRIPTKTALTEPLLDLLGIDHYLLVEDEDAEKIGRAWREAVASRKPVAVLIVKERSR